MMNGEYKTYHGQLANHCFYLNGNLHGEYKRYYRNGQLETHCFYLDGLLHGEHKIYYDSGQLNDSCFYLNGKQNGEYNSYHENGQLREHCFYEISKRNGEYKRYDQNGQLEAHLYFINDTQYRFSFKIKRGLLRIKSYLRKKCRKKIEEEIYKSGVCHDISWLIGSYII